MANGDLFRAQFCWNVANQPACLTLGFEETGTTGSVVGEECSIIAIAVNTALGGLIPFVPEDVDIEGTIVRKITGSPVPKGQAWISNGKGTISGQSIPATKALMIDHKQQTADVMRNGKSYWSGIAEAQVEENNVTSGGLLNALIAAFDQLTSVDQAIPAGSWLGRHVVLSKVGPLPGQWQGLPVTSNTGRNVLYNSRRRTTDAYGFTRDVAVP